MNISSIFSIFSFGSKVKEVFSKENVVKFLEFIQEKITDYVKEKDLLGTEKKKQVDAACIAYMNDNFKGRNSIIDWIVDNILVVILPNISQFVYNCLKKYVFDLTDNS